MAEGTGDKILLVIWITVWIKEFFKGFLIIALIIINGGWGWGVGGWGGVRLGEGICSLNVLVVNHIYYLTLFC